MHQIIDSKDRETSHERPYRGSALLHLLIGGAFFIGLVLILSSVSLLIVGAFLNEGSIADLDLGSIMGKVMESPIALKLVNFFGSSLPFILAAFLACMVFKVSPSYYLKLNKPADGKWFILSIIFVFFSMTLMGFMLEINKLVDFSQWPSSASWLDQKDQSSVEMYEAMVGDRSVLSFASSLLFMALLPALAEELFFRGFLLTAFGGIFNNTHIAILVTSVLFSLIHMQFTKIIPMLFLAMVFGYAVYWSGTIWTAIVAHFINNSIAVTQLYYYTDGDYSKVAEESTSFPWFINIILILGVGFFFRYMQTHSSVKTQNIYE